MVESRNQRLDFIKGIATFLVLWGHIVQYGITDYNCFDDPMYRFIYSFHMPVFIFISGYLFLKSYNRHSYKKLLIRKVSGIMYPCVIWGGLYEIIVLIREYPNVKSLARFIYGAFTDVWFLWTLFCITLIVATALKLSCGKWYLLLPLLGIGGIVLFFLPVNEGNLFMYPFFLLGMLYSKYENVIAISGLKKYLVGCSFFVIFVFLLYGFTSFRLISVGGLYVTGRGTITNDIYRYIIGCVGIIAFAWLFGNLYDNLTPNGKMVHGITGLARFSGEFYCIQQVFVAQIGSMAIHFLSRCLGYNPLTKNQFVFDFLAAPALTWLIVVTLTAVLNKLKKHKHIYNFFFGW